MMAEVQAQVESVDDERREPECGMSTPFPETSNLCLPAQDADEVNIPLEASRRRRARKISRKHILRYIKAQK